MIQYYAHAMTTADGRHIVELVVLHGHHIVRHKTGNATVTLGEAERTQFIDSLKTHPNFYRRVCWQAPKQDWFFSHFVQSEIAEAYYDAAREKKKRKQQSE